jgi:hypothetical protein
VPIAVAVDVRPWHLPVPQTVVGSKDALHVTDPVSVQYIPGILQALQACVKYKTLQVKRKNLELSIEPFE